MRLKTAALFAVGFLSVSLWLHDSARCQTSLAPPLSLAAPPSATAEDAPPTATEDVPPPPAAKRSKPSATAKHRPPAATDDVPPPPVVTQRSTPSATAKDQPPTAALPPSPQPAADYDGFSAGIVDEDTSGQTSKPAKPRPAQPPKRRQKPDSVEGQSVDQIEDEKLRRSLVICSGCKG
jgi:hypothetical protein